MRHPMRHLQRVSVLVLALALATAVAAACASGSTRKPKATLTLASRNPVVVIGRHFTPRLKVQVVLRTGARQSRSAVPNGHGVFTATFSAVIDRCTSWSVRATQPGQAPLLIRGAAKPACPVAGAA